jgi:glutamate--cysteine ligase
MEENPRPTVPNLTTALSGPLQRLETELLANQVAIEQWFRAGFRQAPAPFYCSVDLRNSGFKLAPVDTNLFPAGFNNLNPAFRSLGVQAVQAVVDRICPHARGVVVVPENHTRNMFYFESLAALTEILRMAGLNVRIGSLLPDLREPKTIALPSGRSLLLEPLVREGDKIAVDGFEPCFVLLNNDLSAGRPAILENLKQPVVPPLDLGWSNRLKSHHFSHYRRLAGEFAAMLGIDPWFIDPIFARCGKINFEKNEGEECLVANVQDVLDRVGTKYKEHGIDREPFVILKADAGTYGMAIMSVKSADEVRQLNRKQRNKMSHAKEGSAVTDVIVQEGVYSFETWDGAVAEPVVYMIHHHVVGGFYRVHKDRGPDENLNSPGMHFEPLAFAGPCSCPDPEMRPGAGPNRFYSYGVIARLALLAAAHEQSEVLQRSPQSTPVVAVRA